MRTTIQLFKESIVSCLSYLIFRTYFRLPKPASIRLKEMYFSLCWRRPEDCVKILWMASYTERRRPWDKKIIHSHGELFCFIIFIIVIIVPYLVLCDIQMITYDVKRFSCIFLIKENKVYLWDCSTKSLEGTFSDTSWNG